MANNKSTIVGSALTPSLLKELGAVDKFPPKPEDFDPKGNWQNTYRLWTCHGYRESGNDSVGFLQIRRSADAEESFTLKVRREVVQTDGLVNIIEATIKCRNDQLASPIKWNTSGRFIGADNKPLPQLDKKETGPAAEAVDKTTSDWCLFETVQRLSFDKRTSLSFDLREGLSLSKKGHRLFYRGAYPTDIAGQDSMHCFVQLGSGILPYEYWLDENHRLLMAISLNKAYILDNEAETTIKRITEEMRKSYQKKKT